MIRRGPASVPTPERRGSTLLELLSAMAIYSVLALALGALLQSSLDRFRRGTDGVRDRADLALVMEWLERDLAAHQSSRPAPLPRIVGEVSDLQREKFEGRSFLPFEIDRRSGDGGNSRGSFRNAAPGFASIAFAVGSPESTGRGGCPALVGYYVAYARHSPLVGEDRAGMKLFRHYRPGGHATAEGYSDGLLRYLHRTINRGSIPATGPVGQPDPAAVRRGRLENRDLPFLFSRRLDPGDTSPRECVAPWPTLPVLAHLDAPPPTMHPSRGGPGDWGDPLSPVHEAVYPDEAICDRVVRFELKPFRLVEIPDGELAVLDAAGLNQHLGLSGGDEWPVLVAPHWIEVVLAVVPEPLARRLRRYEDWILDWNRAESDPASDPFGIVAASRTYRFRLALPPRAP